MTAGVRSGAAAFVTSLRARLLASYLLIVVLALLTAGFYVVRQIEWRYTRSYELMLESQARVIAEALRPRMVAGADFRALEQAAKSFEWRKGAYVGVRDATGIKPHLGSDQPPPPPEVLRAREGDAATAQRWDDRNREMRIFAAAPIVQDGEVVGIIHVSAPRLWVDRQLQQIWWAFFTAGLLALVAAAFLGFRISRSITRPLGELERGARAISQGDYGRQVPVRTHDEVGRLGLAFNRMARQLAETIEQIREERNRLEAVLAGIRDAVVAVGPDQTVLLFNGAAREMLGLGDDVVGKKATAAIRNPTLVSLLQAAADGRVQSEEVELDGTGRVVEVTCSPIRATGGLPAGAVAVVRDVTELRRSERLRRELVANVSHELRTPLTSIKGFVETLLGGAMRDERNSRRFLEIIESEANRLVKMVDDLMELSRLESKGVTFETRPVDLAEACAAVAARHQPRAEQAGVRLVCEASDPTVVVADPDRVEQILTNLVDNALKFTSEGGEIRVRLSRQGTEAVVAVCDDGRGIPPDDLPRIFERFYRVDRSRTRGSGGSGLGLAIARHLVEMQGGRIWAVSQPGRGSVFSFALPLAHEPAPHPADAHGSGARNP
ncbi:MAG: ATP-binding protein [Armatimonadota bacterium]|nr:ATP-binding protein [Armatimonadota bacterium]MDR5696454.1 ATP-binding protein [Armatimonadota bacterium]